MKPKYKVGNIVFSHKWRYEVLSVDRGKYESDEPIYRVVNRAINQYETLFESELHRSPPPRPYAYDFSNYEVGT